ncbi:MAG: hypothetical protein QW478_07695 [Candidatus Micrarchaeaceae archaeon]
MEKIDTLSPYTLKANLPVYFYGAYSKYFDIVIFSEEIPKITIVENSKEETQYKSKKHKDILIKLVNDLLNDEMPAYYDGLQILYRKGKNVKSEIMLVINYYEHNNNFVKVSLNNANYLDFLLTVYKVLSS